MLSCMTCIADQNIPVIKWRIMNWLGRVASVGDRIGEQRVLVFGKPEGK